MSADVGILVGGAIILGCVHTLIGPDHYLPFLAMASASKWSPSKTAWVTFLCGLGHILSSVILALIGASFVSTLQHVKRFESIRGEIAPWLLISFGFTYLIWGLHRAIRNKPHSHTHFHIHNGEHTHEHNHTSEHTHVHSAPNLTPWILFTIFVFGPCEVLIPMVMAVSAKSGMRAAAWVVTAFGLSTIATMLAVVMSAYFGLGRLPVKRLGRFSHAIAGLVVLICGVAVKCGM